MNNHNERRATHFGVWALIMWALEPLIISEVSSLPIFELLAIFFFGSFMVTAVRLTRKQSWILIGKQPWFVWCVGLIGICGSDFAYIRAAQLAPIAHVDLIDYLWPCLAVLLSGLLPQERLSWQHLCGSLLGVIGIYVLTAENLTDLKMDYVQGYLLALGGAFLWACYSVFSRYNKETPTEMVGIYCGLGALISLVLHISFESFVMPSLHEGSMVILTGITGAGIAYQLWDFGVKYGNIKLLSMLTYIARVVGMMLLVVCGKEAFSYQLVCACVLTSFGVVLSGLNKTVLSTWWARVTSSKKQDSYEWSLSENPR